MTFREKYYQRIDPQQLLALSQNKGWSYVIGWAHRLTGVLLLLYALLHINTLSSLTQPEIFSRKAEMFSGPVFVFLEWLLAVPVIFHCLNGGRLLVYELFTTRYDDLLRSWVGTLCIVYLLLLGYFMYLGNQVVSPHFFWLTVLIIGVLATYPCALKIRRSRGSFFWKLQRVSGALLFVLVPAHMLFMHLNPAVGRDVETITERLSQPMIAVLDAVLLFCILYHGGYGLIGVMKDYTADSRAVKVISGVVVVILVLFGLQGIALVGSF